MIVLYNTYSLRVFLFSLEMCLKTNGIILIADCFCGLYSLSAKRVNNSINSLSKSPGFICDSQILKEIKA